LRPDDRLRLRVDAAIEALLAGGTIAQIHARCGIELWPRGEGQHARHIPAVDAARR
jgi:hypothetical protein